MADYIFPSPASAVKTIIKFPFLLFYRMAPLAVVVFLAVLFINIKSSIDWEGFAIIAALGILCRLVPFLLSKEERGEFIRSIPQLVLCLIAYAISFILILTVWALDLQKSNLIAQLIIILFLYISGFTCYILLVRHELKRRKYILRTMENGIARVMRHGTTFFYDEEETLKAIKRLEKLLE